jgi:hypothetical protein
MTQEAMKLALDALNKLTDVFLDTEGSYGNYETNAIDQGYEAITALEEVLKEHAMREVQRLGQEIEQEPIGFVQQSVLDWLYSKHRSSNAHTITTIAKSPTETEDVAIYTTPPQRTEQEPDDIASILACRDMLDAQPVPLQPEQEPVFTYEQVKAHIQVAMMSTTTPPQRTWVGLTDEDLRLLSAEWRIVYGAWMDDFARDIEAKLKEKNNG